MLAIEPIPIRPCTLRDLLSLSPEEFEAYSAGLLRGLGYGRVTVTPKGPRGGDGGVDLRVVDESGRLVCLGQCKRWASRPQHGLLQIIRELLGAMTEQGVGRGVLVITAPATSVELRRAAQDGITIIDAQELRRLIAAQQASRMPLSNAHGGVVPCRTARTVRAWLTPVVLVVLALAMLVSLWQVPAIGDRVASLLILGMLLCVPPTWKRRSWRQRGWRNQRQRYRRRRGGWGT